MAVSVALNGAGCAGSVAMFASFGACTHSLQKPRKTCFFGVKTSVGEASLGQSVALNGECRTI